MIEMEVGEILNRLPSDLALVALLREKDGKYLELWNAQAQYYTRENG